MINTEQLRKRKLTKKTSLVKNYFERKKVNNIRTIWITFNNVSNEKKIILYVYCKCNKIHEKENRKFI